MTEEGFCVWYRIRHRHDGRPTGWQRLPRSYPTQSEANMAVAARARMSGVAVEYAVTLEGKSPAL
jgi:hypothetical protein